MSTDVCSAGTELSSGVILLISCALGFLLIFLVHHLRFERQSKMASKPRGKRAAKAAAGAGENVVDDVPVSVSAVSGKNADTNTKPLKETTNNLTLEEELEAMTKALKKVSLEKEQGEALLKAKEEELMAKTLEAERVQEQLNDSVEGKKKLEEKLRKLQKLKEFQPTLSLGVPGPVGNEDLSKKKKKDPNRLKKPKSAFLLWCKEHRQTVCEENPNASFTEIGSIMGEKWKNVTEEERKPYEERYKVEKDIYLKLVGKEKREAEALKLFHEEQNKKQAQELLEQYLAYKKEAESADGGKKKKKEKDPLKPKHPTTAFFAFSNSRRPALLEAKKPVTEISKILGEEWKTLSATKRAPFEKIAAKDKERYAVELETYKKNKAEDLTAAEHEAEEKAKLEKVQALHLFKQKEKVDQAKKMMKDQTKEKKKAKDQAKDPNKPKKPLSSYLLFSMELRKTLTQEQPGMSFVDTNSHLALKWKEISEKEKEVWNVKAAVLKKKYDADMEEYRKNNPEPSA